MHKWLSPASLAPVCPVPPVTIDTLKVWLKDQFVEIINEEKYLPFTGINIDTRTIINNGVIREAFLPLDGKHFQGLSLVSKAISAGVRVVIVAKKYQEEISLLLLHIRESCAFVVVRDAEETYRLVAKYFIALLGGYRIGITGSAGKTSAKEMLVSMFKQVNNKEIKELGVYANFKNENNLIGVPKNIFQLQKKLLDSNASPIHILIFELGMNSPGEIARLGDIVAPHMAVITNILHSHIGNFSHRDDLVHAKGEIISQLVPYKKHVNHPNHKNHKSHEEIAPILFIPHDIYARELFIKKIATDPFSVELHEIRTTFTATLELKLKKQKNENRLMSVETKLSEESKSYTVNGIQIFFVEQIALAVAIGKKFGFSKSEILTTLIKKDEDMNIEKAESRLQIISQNTSSPPLPLIIDDSYNSNPESLAKILYALIDLYRSSWEAGNKFKLNIVLGDILELGNFAEPLYLELANKINRSLENTFTKITSIFKDDFSECAECIKGLQFFFLGTGIKICYDNLLFNIQKYYFAAEKYSSNSDINNEGNKLVARIKTVSDSNTLVFFKASHGMQFKNLVADFVQAVQG